MKKIRNEAVAVKCNQMDNVEKENMINAFREGLEKGAASMTFFTKEDIIVGKVELYDSNSTKVHKVIDSTSALKIILSTKLRGGINGVLYLIFPEHGMDNLLKVRLKEPTSNNEGNSRIMGDALLLEMKHIMTASIITHLCNVFKFNIYEGLSTLRRSYSEEVNKIIIKDNVESYYFISNLYIKTLEMFPQIIWIVDRQSIIKE